METSTIITNIANDKDLTKQIGKSNYYDVERFIEDAKDYISAIKEGRMLCTIPSVAASGMSRVIKFNSFEPSPRENSEIKGYYRQYIGLFEALGYKADKNNRDGFRINGCGMDMVFHTNYSIMHKLKRLGFITKEECETLAQQTPNKL